MAYSENKERSLRGELYIAFTPELIKERARCARALKAFNANEDDSRRKNVELWRNILNDTRPLPPRVEGSTDDEDDALFDNESVIISPFYADYGTNIRVAGGTFINAGCTILDTCLVTIGTRVLFGPNVSLYAGTHPTDPHLRDGFRGPEMGGEIHIGDDCWIGGMVIILPNVRIGRGSTIGAGSVVTKDVPEYSVAVGNPARVIKQAAINTTTAEERQKLHDIAFPK